jgi:tight adherence protein C
MIALIVFLIFIAVSVNTYIILWLPRREARLTKQRLKDLSELQSSQFGTGDVGEVISRPSNPFFKRLTSMFSVFIRKDRPEFSPLRLSLMRAGFYHENAAREYTALRVLSAVILLVVGFIIVFLVRQRTPSALLALLVMMAPVAGYTLPAFILKWKTNSRQEEIAAGLPDALDFLVVCVEAGLGLNAALLRVGSEIKVKSRALGEELTLVNQEMRTGVSRERALRHLSQRNMVEDLNVVVASLILADKLGTSIADTLRAQAESLRTRVRQRAEERAAKSGIKLLFPLVFMILPTLFIVILGPAMIMGIRAMRAMSSH